MIEVTLTIAHRLALAALAAVVVVTATDRATDGRLSKYLHKQTTGKAL